jgi:hypothetical protein
LRLRHSRADTTHEIRLRLISRERVDGLEEWEINDPSPNRSKGSVEGPYKNSLQAQLAANANPGDVTWDIELSTENEAVISADDPKYDGTFDNWYKNGEQEIEVPYRAPENLRGDRVTAFRTWMQDPNRHAGESGSDMWMRLAGSSSYEARRDWASGGGFVSGGLGRTRQVGVTLATVERAEVVAAKGVTPLLEGAVKSNYGRFVSKIPVNSKSSSSYQLLDDGNYLFQATSPGNVPGSSALYQKWVNPQGETFKMIKTTFAPDGSIIHAKPKF